VNRARAHAGQNSVLAGRVVEHGSVIHQAGNHNVCFSRGFARRPRRRRARCDQRLRFLRCAVVHNEAMAGILNAPCNASPNPPEA
jgi:hypothetical protein